MAKRCVWWYQLRDKIRRGDWKPWPGSKYWEPALIESHSGVTLSAVVPFINWSSHSASV